MLNTIVGRMILVVEELCNCSLYKGLVFKLSVFDNWKEKGVESNIPRSVKGYESIGGGTLNS